LDILKLSGESNGGREGKRKSLNWRPVLGKRGEEEGRTQLINGRLRGKEKKTFRYCLVAETCTEREKKGELINVLPLGGKRRKKGRDAALFLVQAIQEKKKNQNISSAT